MSEKVPSSFQAKVEIRGLYKSYESRDGEGALQVLEDINLEVKASEFVCIVGASGCGKTSLLKVIDGLVPFDSGEVLVDGKRIAGPGLDRGFVFQGDSLLPWLDVERNISFGLDVQRIRDEKRINHLLRLVGLEAFRKRFPYQLSGGMRQRANIARALAIDPDILLMDEPLAALDAQTREIMQLELLRIWEEQKKTVLFVTHQIEEAVFLADRVVVLSARPGRMKADVQIDIQRPRVMKQKHQGRFQSFVEEIWKLIESDVFHSMEV